jgi:hypothetical protein
MNIRKTYRMQQLYYRDFYFHPTRVVQKHNYFAYMVYKPVPKLKLLFDTVLNNEVLDNNHILTIRQTIIKLGVPLTQAVSADVKHAGDTVSLFFRDMESDPNDLAHVEKTINILQRSLGKFAEVEQKLTDELTNLLFSYDFTGRYSITSHDIDNILDVLHEVCKGIQRSIKRLSDFTSDMPLIEKNSQPGLKATTSVNNLITGLHRWCTVQEAIIIQLQDWRSVRAAHERQEVLN